MTPIKYALLVITVGLAGCTGGGETVVSGFGNSGNHFGEENETVLLARAIARDPGTPQITDEELSTAPNALKSRAMEGESSAALVLYRVAAHQRAAQAEEAED